MKRGIILALLVALILLLPAQAALAMGKGDRSKGEGLAATRGQTSEAKDTVGEEDATAPVKAKGQDRADQAKAQGGPAKTTGPPVKNAKPGRDVTPDPESADEPTTGGVPVQKPPAPEVQSGHAESSGPPSVVSIEPVFVELHAPHVGANSQTFGDGCCSDHEAVEVVWHFVLNGLDHGTPAAQLTVTFKDAGEMSATGRVVGNGSTQHFYVTTSGHDVLLGGVAEVQSVGTGKLVLSEVSCPSVTEPDEPDKPDDEDNGDDHDNGQDQDDGDEQGDGDTTDEEPFLPFTEPRPQVVVYETYLPYTGDVGSLLMALALGAAVTGRRLRSAGRRRR
jgi:hypothetical protein